MARRSGIDPALEQYIVQLGLRDDPLAARLREETAALPQAGMQISAVQAAFMANVARMIGARRCIEVGTFTGYSALAVARALPPDGLLVACDVSEAWTAIARRYWREAGVADRIDLRLGPAIDTLDTLLHDGQAGTFDLAFIDADKEGYDAYFERCLALLRDGGCVLVDNVLWGGAVIDASNTTDSTLAIRRFNEARATDPRIDLSMIPVGDGVSLMVKRPAAPRP